MTTAERVGQIIGAYLPGKLWGAHQTFDEIGIDSLDRVQIAIDITEAFGLGDGLDQRPELDTAEKIVAWLDASQIDVDHAADAFAYAMIAVMPPDRDWGLKPEAPLELTPDMEIPMSTEQENGAESALAAAKVQAEAAILDVVKLAHASASKLKFMNQIDQRALATALTKLDEARLWLGEAFK